MYNDVCAGTSTDDLSVKSKGDTSSDGEDETTAEESEMAATGKVQKRKQSTFQNHPWIIKVTDGYLCRLCYEHLSAKERGKWITDPIPVKASKKLYEKAKKHATSTLHQMSLAADNMQHSSSGDVAEQITVQAQTQSDENKQNIFRLFRLAYFLFSQEIPHTTNWRALVSSVSSSLPDSTLSRYIKNAPGNAHHLSEGAVTDIMEAFGEAIQNNLKTRLAGITEYAVMADECTDVNAHEVVSVCVRFIENSTVTEMFIGCWPVKSTAAVDVCACIVHGLESLGLNPRHIVAVAFDGAANMSGNKGGVQVLLKEHSTDLIYVHCRSHLLQLALVRAADRTPAVKRVLAVINKLYAMFKHSPKRLAVLEGVQFAVDGISHKLVHAGSTRWLSYDGSIAVVLKHYTAICLALESIYADAADLSCDAGGLLLELKNAQTLYLICVLHHIFQPLARLSMALQTKDASISTSMALVKTTISGIKDFSPEAVENDVPATMSKLKDAGISTSPLNECVKTGANQFIQHVVTNLEMRFSDDVSSLCSLHEILKQRIPTPDFSNIAKVLRASSQEMQKEWEFIRRLDGDLSSEEQMVAIAMSSQYSKMYPTFSGALRRLLLLPVGTATVERSFSTLNCILTS